MDLTDSQGNWTVISPWSGNLPLDPRMPLQNRYDTLGLEKTECMRNGQDPGKDNHTKSDQPTTCVRTCATKIAKGAIFMSRDWIRKAEAQMELSLAKDAEYNKEGF